jgi:hypothetical protein
MPYKTDKKIFDEFDNKFEYTDFLPSSIKTGNIKQFISDLRKADRESLITTMIFNSGRERHEEWLSAMNFMINYLKSL